MSDAMEVEAAETATAPAGATGGLAKKTPTSTPMDPLDSKPSSVVREGDFVILVFGDGRQIFAHCVKSWRGKAPPVKINKRSYPTANLIGLPYGTVLEVERTRLAPLPPTEDLIPHYPSAAATTTTTAQATDSDQARKDENNDTTFPPLEQERDNRHLLDDNTSQSLDAAALERLRNAGTDGSAIVDKLIANSATFDQKTDFSKAKYVTRKQMKYQPRCRMVRCTPASVCEAVYMKDPRKLMNMREDTLGQILSYSNINAGCQALIFESCYGVLTGAVAQRMGGYGKVFSVFSGQAPPFSDMIQRYNLSFAENMSIKYVHSGDVFCEDNDLTLDDEPDQEKIDRELLEWPCPLQAHTRDYLENMRTERDRADFLAKRCARFTRKLTRNTPAETSGWLKQRPCDSLIVASRYDPTETLLALLPYLAPSRPFVVFCEFVEPLTECFLELQRQDLAINLRLSDTWTREYQVLPGRTHPNMNMSQSGGFLLTGIKLCPETGHNELDEELLKEIRGTIGGRRGRKTKSKNGGGEDPKNSRNKKKSASAPGVSDREAKRAKKADTQS